MRNMHITQALSMYCEDHLLDILIKDLPTTDKPLPKNHIDSLKTAYDSQRRNIAAVKWEKVKFPNPSNFWALST